jgi:hypothetical protein
MNRIRKALPFALLLSTLLLFAARARAGTYTAADCNQNSVNAVIHGPTHTAVDGDVINIPAGSCTWTSGITIPVGLGITIIGSGTPNGKRSLRILYGNCYHPCQRREQHVRGSPRRNGFTDPHLVHEDSCLNQSH